MTDLPAGADERVKAILEILPDQPLPALAEVAAACAIVCARSGLDDSDAHNAVQQALDAWRETEPEGTLQ